VFGKSQKLSQQQKQKRLCLPAKVRGIDEKSGIILEFLEIKIAEHETLYKGDQEFAR